MKVCLKEVLDTIPIVPITIGIGITGTDSLVKGESLFISDDLSLASSKYDVMSHAGFDKTTTVISK